MKAAWKDPEARKKFLAGRMTEKRRVREEMISEGNVDCARCGLVKPLSEFSPGRRHKNGQNKYRYCKACHREVARIHRMKSQFNLTIEDYELLLSSQNGVCAVCGNVPRKNRLGVDHNHKTGLIRGLLCAFCNRVIGLMRDDADRFERVVTYLRSPPASSVLGGDRFGILGRISNKASTKRRLNRNNNFLDTPEKTLKKKAVGL